MRHFTLFLFCLLSVPLFSQTQLAGLVLDELGEPLPFASVAASGTTTGAMADEDGYYSLLVPDGVEELVFSYVGYATTTKSLMAAANGWLEASLGGGIMLQEVVVVGYGFTLCRMSTCCNCVTSIDCFETKNGIQNLARAVETPADRFALSVSEVKVFPNPFVSELHLGLTVLEAGEIEATLYDMKGRQVANWSKLSLVEGESTTTLRINDKRLVPGNYVLRLSDEAGNYKSIKLINTASTSH